MRYSDYSNFDEQLYDLIYADPNEVFSDMKFKQSRSYWSSTVHIDGDPDGDNAPTTYIYANNPGVAIDYARGNKNVIKMYADLNKITFGEARRELAAKYGREVPSFFTDKNTAEYDRLRQSRDKAQTAFVKALRSGSDDAKEVLDYLYNRHWTDEEITAAGFGLCNRDVLMSLEDRSEFEHPASIGLTHKLSLPYKNGSRIFGFKFRTLDPTVEKDKYMNNDGLPKGDGLFNMPYKAKEIVIVEGELDALHAQVRLDALRSKTKCKEYHVVASGGNCATEAQLADARRRGVEEITLLFDNDGEIHFDENGNPNGKKGKWYTYQTYTLANRMGFDVYVACLDECKDSDEYLGQHEDTEDYKRIIDSAEEGFMWKYNNVILPKYADREDEQGEVFKKQRRAFLKDVTALMLEEMNPLDWKRIETELERGSEGIQISMDELHNALVARHDKQNETKRESLVKNAREGIDAALKINDYDKAVAIMEETAGKARAGYGVADFVEVFSPKTPSEVCKLIGGIAEGIPTGFSFPYNNRPKNPFTLDAGMTFICGNRAHGKTSVLNNIAINVARRNIIEGNGQTVLYVSQEISLSNLYADFINTFVNVPTISDNPRDTIISYYRGDGDRYFSRSVQGLPAGFKLPKGHGYLPGQDVAKITAYDYFLREQEFFMQNYIKTGALLPIDRNYKAEQLADNIERLISYRPVSLVCIDYAQLLYSEYQMRSRPEELKKIMNDLKNVANKTGIPFLVAAQFNRSVFTPLDLDTANIGEAGDIERVADTVAGIFHLKELTKPSLHTKAGGTDDDLKELLFNVTGMDEKAKAAVANYEKVPNKLFMRLLKRRNGYFPIDTVLNWEGKTKYIAPNDQDYIDRYIEFKDPEPEQPSVFGRVYYNGKQIIK